MGRICYDLAANRRWKYDPWGSSRYLMWYSKIVLRNVKLLGNPNSVHTTIRLEDFYFFIDIFDNGLPHRGASNTLKLSKRNCAWFDGYSIRIRNSILTAWLSCLPFSKKICWSPSLKFAQTLLGYVIKTSPFILFSKNIIFSNTI